MRIWEILGEQVREPALVVDPDSEMDRKEIYSLLNKYKETLGPKTAEMVDMWINGDTMETIGDRFDMSEQNAGRIVKKALLILKDRMNMAVGTDVGYLYGYKKGTNPERGVGSHAYTLYPNSLKKEIEGNPNLKIVRVGANGFTVVHRSDPRQEVIWTPNYHEKVAGMQQQLSDLKNTVERMRSNALNADGGRSAVMRTRHNRDNLERDERFRAMLSRIKDLEAKIPTVKLQTSWQDADLNEAEVWDQPNPNNDHKKLSPAKKAAAKARAKRAGRPYPNLVDNMWASKK